MGRNEILKLKVDEMKGKLVELGLTTTVTRAPHMATLVLRHQEKCDTKHLVVRRLLCAKLQTP